ncbi:hypothetical protein CLO00_005141 [Escherichia coli]|jgi:hypothetical protein|uniref:hypothetical protein n=1 Tax=Enterobacteriaceae TaxID=543 RepID=UPI000CDCFE69|nr:hypothetical protein [Citrobacter freundii complex sp. CFNIH7]EFD9530865.1 hypothetical protein [Escherichia coli]POU04946.1 hypothetical protein C3368_26610 [Citrobacter freundii complex sp. CFNIH7]HCJ7657325.1 hypothetical protein [Klebsiella pneumoniae]HEG1879496.1 hypothetical protein [Enterobacter kobei]
MADKITVFISEDRKNKNIIRMFDVSILKNGVFLDKLKLNKPGVDHFLYFQEIIKARNVEVFYE